MDMGRHMFKNIVCILRESSLYKTLSVRKKRSLIKGLTKNYIFLEADISEDIVGYESSWADIIQTSR
jgi:hypothetical protein